MKKLLLALAMCSTFIFSCNSSDQQTTEQPVVSENAELHAIYFHTTRRCVTCQAVEKIAAETFNKADLPFKSVNLDDETSKDLATQFGVTGQALLLIKGDKKINLTNTGFLNARNHPKIFVHDINKAIAEIES